MIKLIEKDPLPPVCENCSDDCGSCDYCLERFEMVEVEEETE